MPTARPVLPSERADILDILRGFALLGIGLANSYTLSLYIYQTKATQQSMPTHIADEWLDILKTIFLEQKFYSIFSLLFGVGFSIILARQQKAGNNALLFFYRRLAVLALFGLLHCLLIWDGDILFFYAVVGCFLPLFRNWSNKSLLILATGLLISPILFDLVKVLTEGRWNISTPFHNEAKKLDELYGIALPGQPPSYATWLLNHDSYRDLLKWNYDGFFWGVYLRLDSNRVPKVLALFIIGYFIGKNELYNRLADYRRQIIRIAIWGFAIAIPAGIALAFFDQGAKPLPAPSGLWDTAFATLNTVPLALAYIACLCLLYLKTRTNGLLTRLAPVGRMALTNYIMQSVFGVTLYYGIGFGAGGKLGPAFFMTVFFAFYIVQILYSTWWARHFQYGPLEWIWRQLTYGRRLPIRHKKLQPAVSTA